MRPCNIPRERSPWQTITCLALTVVVFIATLQTAPAGTPSAETIVVQVSGRLLQQPESATRAQMLGLLLHSPAISSETVEKAATSYLQAHLPQTDHVIDWNSLAQKTLPSDRPITLLRIDYTIWPHDIEGKHVVVGTLALHKNILQRGEAICDPARESAFMPVDTFVVGKDSAETARDVDAAISRLLAGIKNHN